MCKGHMSYDLRLKVDRGSKIQLCSCIYSMMWSCVSQITVIGLFQSRCMNRGDGIVIMMFIHCIYILLAVRFISFAVGIHCSWMSGKQTVRIHTYELMPVLRGSDSQSSSWECCWFSSLLASQLHSSDISGINQPDYMAKMKTYRLGQSRGPGFRSAALRKAVLEYRVKIRNRSLFPKSKSWVKEAAFRQPYGNIDWPAYTLISGRNI